MTNPHPAKLFLLAALITGVTLLYLSAPSHAAAQGRPEGAAAPGGVGLQGYAEPLKPSGDDISPEQRANVERKVKDYEARYGTLGPRRVTGADAAAATTSPQSYPFYPQAGILWQDLYIRNFADLNASGGVLDWDCSDYTYDGHKGHDAGIGSFKRQAIGVPVFAALDGVVVDAHDGEPDMNTTWANQPANYVVLDHGNTHYTWYWHLKRGSVAVSVNQLVKAGTQLGLTASSGHSTGPHLHFESRYQGTWYEPNAGPCRAGTSNWVRQTPIRRGAYARDFVLSPSGFAGSAGLPFDEAVRTGTFLSGPRAVYFRVDMGEIPAAGTYRVRFVRPDGTTSLDYPGAFNNSSTTHGGYYWFAFNWTLNSTGVWRVLFDVNGVTIVDAPFKVVATEAEIINRPPNPVGKVTFDPATPTPDDAVFCRVQTSLVTEDPDYDLVRYRYQWSRNGVLIRDRVSAALSDAVPKGSYQAGDTLTCKVTPSDGTASGPSATVSFANCDGTLTPAGKSFAAAGGVGSVSLAIGGTCAWTAKSNVSWITLAAGAASGTGSKAIGYTVAANTGAASRTGTLTVAGKTFTVTQSAQTHTISGQVKLGTAALGGVKMTLSSPSPAGFTPRTFLTTSTGAYSFPNLPAGRSYALTPTKLYYSFTPATKNFPGLSADQAAQNFAATLNTHTIGGKVLVGTAPLAGVTVTLKSPSPAGFTPRTATTNSLGNYSFASLPAGRTYYVTPSKLHYIFTPASRTYTGLSANQTAANFAATLRTYSISGKVIRSGTTTGLAGVTVTVTGPTPAGFSPRTVQTTSTGAYTLLNLPAGRNYTVKPTLTGFTFSPAYRNFANLSTNQAAGPATSFTGTQ